ncbi:hypothetical protein GPECTOR_77g21 [Gonium pectorale]|uniref:Protein kinase domain-containing protein n=1 Tax=Gonium pectorale TaxID=33097 RepID=A0A150G277_GONPE|nr:hypothetical protein GPECTOR_77g21 [Gonium pectorale]|eukprot:KXZ43924.1 hypothetical protein GPECTOR_77g21 [Gonium pectorale]
MYFCMMPDNPGVTPCGPTATYDMVSASDRSTVGGQLLAFQTPDNFLYLTFRLSCPYALRSGYSATAPYALGVYVWNSTDSSGTPQYADGLTLSGGLYTCLTAVVDLGHVCDPSKSLYVGGTPYGQSNHDCGCLPGADACPTADLSASDRVVLQPSFYSVPSSTACRPATEGAMTKFIPQTPDGSGVLQWDSTACGPYGTERPVPTPSSPSPPSPGGPTGTRSDTLPSSPAPAPTSPLPLAPFPPARTSPSLPTSTPAPTPAPPSPVPSPAPSPSPGSQGSASGGNEPPSPVPSPGPQHDPHPASPLDSPSPPAPLPPAPPAHGHTNAAKSFFAGAGIGVLVGCGAVAMALLCCCGITLYVMCRRGSRSESSVDGGDDDPSLPRGSRVPSADGAASLRSLSNFSFAMVPHAFDKENQYQYRRRGSGSAHGGRDMEKGGSFGGGGGRGGSGRFAYMLPDPSAGSLSGESHMSRPLSSFGDMSTAQIQVELERHSARGSAGAGGPRDLLAAHAAAAAAMGAQARHLAAHGGAGTGAGAIPRGGDRQPGRRGGLVEMSSSPQTGGKSPARRNGGGSGGGFFRKLRFQVGPAPAAKALAAAAAATATQAASAQPAATAVGASSTGSQTPAAAPQRHEDLDGRESLDLLPPAPLLLPAVSFERSGGGDGADGTGVGSRAPSFSLPAAGPAAAAVAPADGLPSRGSHGLLQTRRSGNLSGRAAAAVMRDSADACAAVGGDAAAAASASASSGLLSPAQSLGVRGSGAAAATSAYPSVFATPIAASPAAAALKATGSGGGHYPSVYCNNAAGGDGGSGAGGGGSFPAPRQPPPPPARVPSFGPLHLPESTFATHAPLNLDDDDDDDDGGGPGGAAAANLVPYGSAAALSPMAEARSSSSVGSAVTLFSPSLNRVDNGSGGAGGAGSSAPSLLAASAPSPFAGRPGQEQALGSATEAPPPTATAAQRSPTLPTLQEEAAAAAEVLGALVHLHGRRMVHRDIKPANIMWFDEAHRFKLIDLAECAAAGETAPPACTPLYSAPEQIKAALEATAAAATSAGGAATAADAAAAAVGPAADMWSFGIVAYEVLSGGERFYGSPPPPLAEVLEAAFGHRPLPTEGDDGGALGCVEPPQARRLIRHLLVRPPAQRWSAATCHRAALFSSGDDTEQRAARWDSMFSRLDEVQQVVSANAAEMRTAQLAINFTICEPAPDSPGAASFASASSLSAGGALDRCASSASYASTSTASGQAPPRLRHMDSSRLTRSAAAYRAVPMTTDDCIPGGEPIFMLLQKRSYQIRITIAHAKGLALDIEGVEALKITTPDNQVQLLPVRLETGLRDGAVEYVADWDLSSARSRHLSSVTATEGPVQRRVVFLAAQLLGLRLRGLAEPVAVNTTLHVAIADRASVRYGMARLRLWSADRWSQAPQWMRDVAKGTMVLVRVAGNVVGV